VLQESAHSPLSDHLIFIAGLAALLPISSFPKLCDIFMRSLKRSRQAVDEADLGVIKLAAAQGMPKSGTLEVC
jgi:hypothetical protein